MDNTSHHHDNPIANSAAKSSSYSRTSSISMKKRRRRAQQFMTQTKFIVVLLSLLYIGENNNFYSSITPFRGEESIILNKGFVIGVAAASSSSASARSDEKEKENKRMKMMKVTASPNVPILRRKSSNEENESTKSKKSFEFLKEKESQGKKEGGGAKQMNVSDILKKAGKSGIGGGIPGAIAGVVQVFTLMWLRTVMNYQCRYGSSFMQSLRALYNQGGIPRFYRGLSFALIQAPLARFVATAANDGVETLLANVSFTKHWGAGRTTVIASMIVGMWRIFLMPIDTCKTVLQVDSVDGFRSLMRKVKAGKIFVLYQGK